MVDVLAEFRAALDAETESLHKALEAEAAAGGLGAETARIFLSGKCVDCGAERPIWTFHCRECRSRMTEELVKWAYNNAPHMII